MKGRDQMSTHKEKAHCGCGEPTCAQCAPIFYATSDHFSAEEIKEQFRGVGDRFLQADFTDKNVLCSSDNIDEENVGSEEEFAELIEEREELIIEALEEKGFELSGVIKEGSGRWWIYKGENEVWWVATAVFFQGQIFHAPINN